MEYKFYLVQDSDGEFIKKKNRQYDDDWTDDIKKAKVYTGRGSARAMIGRYLDEQNTELGPFLLEFNANLVEKHDVSKELTDKWYKEKVKKEKQDLAKLEKEVKEAQERLNEAKRK